MVLNYLQEKHHSNICLAPDAQRLPYRFTVVYLQQKMLAWFVEAQAVTPQKFNSIYLAIS